MTDYKIKMFDMKSSTRRVIAGDVIKTNDDTCAVLWGSNDGLVAHVIIEDGRTATAPRLEKLATDDAKVIGHVQERLFLEDEAQYMKKHRKLVKAYFAAQEK